MSRGEMLQVQMNIIETKQIYKPWLPLLKANLPRSTRTKGGKRDSSQRWQMSLMTWKNCDIVVVLIYGVDTKVNEKLTLLTKVYKAVCQSMGEENINKLVRRSNHTLLCHCHTMTADKISLLYFFAILDELWTMTLTQESLKGDMSEMIKFTYELKCFKDALEIRVNISTFPFPT